MAKYNIHKQLHNLLAHKLSSIEEWFASEYKNIDPLFYTSVDIRDSGYKIVPVDTNIFPAGFNNIDPGKYSNVSRQIDKFLAKYPKNSNILIIPESHTRNKFYLENIKILQRLIEDTNREVIIGDLNDDLIKQNSKLITKQTFTPDIIILNNDLTTDIPEILQNIEQPILPDTKSGWHLREKTNHFIKYDEILSRFCKEFQLDQFLLSAAFENCGEVNFQDSKGIDCIANHVEKIIHLLRNKYKEYEMDKEPYVFIKAEKGTYGMGIMTVSSAEEVYTMNRKLRKKMHVIKEGIINTKVVIQEGIKTNLRYDDYPAEVMSYLIGGQIADSFLRVNKSRDEYTSLNKAGVEFLPIAQSKQAPDDLGIYHILAKLATLAAAYE